MPKTRRRSRRPAPVQALLCQLGGSLGARGADGTRPGAWGAARRKRLRRQHGDKHTGRTFGSARLRPSIVRGGSAAAVDRERGDVSGTRIGCALLLLLLLLLLLPTTINYYYYYYYYYDYFYYYYWPAAPALWLLLWRGPRQTKREREREVSKRRRQGALRGQAARQHSGGLQGSKAARQQGSQASR
jgi:hypothetical protein